MGERQQADGGGDKTGDPTGSGRGGGGESGGGASPLEPGGDGGEDQPVTGHGGQSEIAYHGPGKLGEQRAGGSESPNAPTSSGD